MKTYRIAILSFALSIALATVAHADDKVVPGWDPTVFRDASTIKIMTTEPDVGEHWSNLWVVVIDGQPYIRLGDRSYGRIHRNTTSPYVKLKVADQEFDKVKVEEMPRHEGKGRRRDGRQVLDGHPHPARVASYGRAPSSRGLSTPDIITLTAPPDPCPWPADSADRHVQSAHTQVVIERSQGNGLIKQKRDRLRTGPSEHAALDYRLCFSRASNASATVSMNLL